MIHLIDQIVDKLKTNDDLDRDDVYNLEIAMCRTAIRGRLSTEDFNEFRERFPNIHGDCAKYIGMDCPAFSKYIFSGELEASPFLGLLNKIITKKDNHIIDPETGEVIDDGFNESGEKRTV